MVSHHNLLYNCSSSRRRRKRGQPPTMNVVSFALFGWDKLCSMRRWWRVSENDLLCSIALGETMIHKIHNTIR
jgi:hypothetical protein